MRSREFTPGWFKSVLSFGGNTKEALYVTQVPSWMTKQFLVKRKNSRQKVANFKDLSRSVVG